MLTGWLGSTNSVDPAHLSPPSRTRHTPVKNLHKTKYTLGVLGTRNRTDYESIQTEIIGPMIAEWGLPSQIIIPSEGESSHVLMLWAQQKDIPIHMASSDWTGHGRKASMIRDTYIQQEADRILFLQGPRSTKIAATANRLAKKGRMVALSERPGLPLQVL